ncbi:MAG: bifunctional adenosylcobinamide kinase/adenosylcobinamide-phosphate guanylyltransferase [Oscillospiraceae bacterium]|nr:bifunctional adenosylcobinamide kinase/adenosylcobinamide-phosphate guanylyltransferase [Oscillospiraceae bacterium]
MIFVTGPLFAGKKEYIRTALGLTDEEFAACAVWDVQELAGAADLSALADRLSQNRVVIATELGGGVIPTDAAERAHREAAGRLACLLAERADTVIRVCCGLPQVLKGSLSC